eukprot:3880263-Prymnesium_polylepis.1
MAAQQARSGRAAGGQRNGARRHVMAAGWLRLVARRSSRRERRVAPGLPRAPVAGVCAGGPRARVRALWARLECPDDPMCVDPCAPSHAHVLPRCDLRARRTRVYF